MQYTRLNRSDLKTWDATMWGIVADAQADGWLFGMSGNGHAIGRSPDGGATISVPRSDQRRSGANARAELARWKVRQERSASDQRRIDDALAKMEDPLFRVTDEQIAERTEEILDQFIPADDSDGESLTDAHKVILRNVLGQRETLSRMLTHITAHGRYPEWLGLDLDAEDGGITENTRAWRVQWGFYDKATQHVIMSGGPNMDDETAERYVAEMAAARVRLADRTCPTCKRTFADLRARRAHESTHRKATRCPNCGETFVGIGRHRVVCDARYAQLAAEQEHTSDGPDATPGDVEASPTTTDRGVAARAARPDAVEAIMDLLTEVEELRALALTDAAQQVAALREQVAALHVELTEARDDAGHWRKLAEDAEVEMAAQRAHAEAAAAKVAAMHDALGVRPA